MKRRQAKKICELIARDWRNSFRYSLNQAEAAKAAWLWPHFKRDQRGWAALADGRD